MNKERKRERYRMEREWGGWTVCTFFVLLSFSVRWLIRSVLCKSTVLNEGIKKNLGEMEREGEDSVSLHREEGRMKRGGGWWLGRSDDLV